MPSATPNLLANGAQGIAVGMATSIPPHNVAELCDAALYLIAHPGADVGSAAAIRARPGFPDRRHRRRRSHVDRGDLSHRARRFPAALALGARGAGPRRLGRRGDRNSLWRAEVAPDRAAGDAAQRQEGAAARRRPRRIHRGRAHRARAARAQCRARGDDGAALQAQRAGDPHFRQHERARGRRHAARDRPQRSAAAMARPSPLGAAAALAPSPRRDRETPRARRRHDHRLPQSGRGHPDRARGRGPQGLADGALHDERSAGQLRARYAPALVAPPRGNAAAQGAGRTRQGKGRDRLPARLRQEAMVRDRLRDPRHQEEIRAGDPDRQTAHHLRGAAECRRSTSPNR